MKVRKIDGYGSDKIIVRASVVANNKKRYLYQTVWKDLLTNDQLQDLEEYRLVDLLWLDPLNMVGFEELEKEPTHAVSCEIVADMTDQQIRDFHALVADFVRENNVLLRQYSAKLICKD